jgi:glycosyltransferase involved in cell wall biosynthesis
LENLPLVSVLLPVFNSEKYVSEAINSILNQTYQNFEIIVIDDGSTDGTALRIQEFDDKRIRYFKNQENLGITKTLNRYIDQCKGKYIARMDADDISLPKRLESQVKYLESNPEYVLIGTAYLKQENNAIAQVRKHTTGYQKLRVKLLFGNNISHPSVMFNKNNWVKSGEFYDENLRYAQDYDLWTRLILKHRITNLKDPLIVYRRYDGVTNPSKRKITNDNIKNAQIRYIDSLLQLNDYELASRLYLLYRRPETLKISESFTLAICSIRFGFKIKDFHFALFLLRIINQLRKVIYK